MTVLAACALWGAAAQINSPSAPGYFARGMAMYGLENYVGTADQLRQASHSRLLTADEQRRLEQAEAMCAFHRGDYTEARRMLEAWLERWGAAPERNDVLMAVGDCLFESSYPDALRVYDMVDGRALANSDRALALAYRKGYCSMKLALWDQADAQFATLLGSGEYGDAARFYQAYIAYARGDYQTAKTGFLSANTNRAPGNMADYYLSQIYYNEGDYGRALDTARALLRRGDTEKAFTAEANRIAGECLYLTGNGDEAIPYLRRYAANVDSPTISALYILGLSEYGAGEYAAAVKTLRPVSADNSSMGQNAYLYIGQALLHEGDTDGAIMAFDRALHLDYDDAAREAAYYNYAVAKYDGATVPFGSSVAVFEDFLRLFPDSKYADDVRRYIISGYVTDNNYEAALASINRVARPSDAVLGAKQQVLYTLGTRNLIAGNATAAIPQLREALSLQRFNKDIARETRLALGEALLRKGDNAEESVTLLNEYLDGPRTSNTPVAYYDLGYAQMALRNYRVAESAFRKVISSPGNLEKATVADAWTRIGDCLYYRKDWTQAADAYSRAYDMMPTAGDYPLFQQAVMQGYAGNFDSKLEDLRRLQREFPTSTLLPDALLEMTEAQLRTGDTDGAIATLRRLIDRYGSTTQGRTAYLQLAATYTDNSRENEAITTYKALIASSPTSDEGAQAAEALKRIYASRGDMDEYLTFMNSIDNAPRIDPAEAEKAAFEAAEQRFLNGSGAKLLNQYVNRYGDNGVFALQAYSYLMDDADEHGRTDDAYRYARHIIDRWPDNAAAEQAYSIAGATEYARGNGEQALMSWQQLERRASTPAMANEARMGIMRVARDLGRPDDIIKTADAVLASSTLGSEDKMEASYSRGLAFRLKGDDRSAVAAWRPLANGSDMLYGAKSAVSLAETLLSLGEKDEARQVAETFVNSGTPHSYWLARGFIVLADAYKALGKPYEAREYLKALRENYPGNEPDIFQMIDERLGK